MRKGIRDREEKEKTVEHENTGLLDLNLLSCKLKQNVKVMGWKRNRFLMEELPRIRIVYTNEKKWGLNKI